jgi:hypothetical protein
MLSEFLFRIFLGVALVVVVFVNLWYLKLLTKNLKDGATDAEDEEERIINGADHGVAL